MRNAKLMMLSLAVGANHLMAQIARPSAYWFGKAVTTERTRQVYAGLNANMWLLYDMPQAVLYQAWKGGTLGGTLELANATLTPGYWFNGGPHFPHIFVPAGTDYFHDQVGEYFASYTKPAHIDIYYTKWPKQPRNYKSWVVMNGTSDAGATVRFRAYSIFGNVFALRYSLILLDKSEITITESPEFSSAGGKNNLVRTFTFSGIPSGYQVRLLKPGGADAAWSVTSGSAIFSAGVMTQTANGQSILTGSW
jgi:hypothetical protein